MDKATFDQIDSLTRMLDKGVISQEEALEKSMGAIFCDSTTDILNSNVLSSAATVSEKLNNERGILRKKMQLAMAEYDYAMVRLWSELKIAVEKEKAIS